MACWLLKNCSNFVTIDPEFVFRPIVTHFVDCVENSLSTRFSFVEPVIQLMQILILFS
jgi:hypothetical protein